MGGVLSVCFAFLVLVLFLFWLVLIVFFILLFLFFFFCMLRVEGIENGISRTSESQGGTEDR